MNSRDYKIFRAGNYYHVFNRGNNKQTIFIDDQDYLIFINRLKLALGIIKPQGSAKNRVRIQPFPKGSFSIVCYCLMPNHFHFLIRQDSRINIDRLIAKICTSYAKYFNAKYQHIGNVFQDRFKSKIVDNDSYLTYLSAYIHNNPANPLDYNFSSLKDYCGISQAGVCEETFLLGMFDNDPKKYQKFVLSYSEKDEQKIKNYIFED